MKLNQRCSVVALSLFLALPLTMSLSSCGGGNGDDDTPAADTTDPTVAVTALPATVNRTVNVKATASDDTAVTEVEFFVDGTSIGTDGSDPYAASWDTSTVEEAAHEITAVARDAAGNSATSSAVSVTVQNELEFALELSGDQEVPVVNSAGSATGTLHVNAATGAVSGSITVDGFTAIAAHVHDAFAGTSGEVLVGLEADGDDPDLWAIPDGSTLTSEQVDRLLAGALYVNAHSAAFPDGEVRAQLVPANITLIFTDLTGAEEVPPVTTTGSARAATTVDTEALTVTINVNTTDLETASDAHIHMAPPGESGDVVIPLEQDTTTPPLWSATAAAITSEQLADFRANDWYVNVHTPANPTGEVRGQIIVTDEDTEVPTVTLGAIAATVNGTVTLTATAADNINVAAVRFLVDGTVIGTDTSEPYSFDWDTTAAANSGVEVTAEAEDDAGNVGTSTAVATTIDNPTGPVPYTFAEIQTEIFDARCITCHSGGGAPQGLDLSPSSSYGLLVGTASNEVPALERVEAGNADDSYLIRKLEGAAGIVGGRMPLGGPYLSQDTIDRVRAWIDGGAPND